MLEPKLDILPEAQRNLWPELRETPPSFVLYGGTALALRLGHRQSIDFDFFSNDQFEPANLLYAIRYLKDARIDQRTTNTLTVTIDRGGAVQVSFFGDVRMRSIEPPDIAGNGVQIAALPDIAATKLNTIQQRAEAKDYIDIAAALDAGVTVPCALATAIAIYGRSFNAVAALKSLSYFEDGNLPSLPATVQERLRTAAQNVELSVLPAVSPRATITREDIRP